MPHVRCPRSICTSMFMSTPICAMCTGTMRAHAHVRHARAAHVFEGLVLQVGLVEHLERHLLQIGRPARAHRATHTPRGNEVAGRTSVQGESARAQMCSAK
eukprot:1222676-Prymnesium_polylepis.1